jgi:Resolvase, N terminal domain
MATGNTARLVYGYIRAEEPDEIEIALLRKEMAAFCEEHDYRLTNVCCDRGSDGTEWGRAGFAAALDALALPSSYGLLVPALAHLSTDAVVRDGLVRLVRRTGAKLLVLHAEQPNEAKTVS